MMLGDEPARQSGGADLPVPARPEGDRRAALFAAHPRGWAAAVRRALWRHKIATAATAAVLAFAAVATVVATPGRPHGAVPRVPGFTLPALGNARERVSLAAYAGRPVVVNFFASWCVPCKKETPLLARFFRTPHGRVAMIGVDVNDAPAAALRFARRAGVTYAVGVDRTAATAEAWGVVAIPQTFFLDAGRHVVKRVFGAVTLAELTRDTALLAGR